VTPLDRALERRDAERQQRRVANWSIVLRRPPDAPALPLADGVEAFYNLLQPALGYAPRVTETRDELTFSGDEDGRGLVLLSRADGGNPRDGYNRIGRATSVGVDKTTLDVDLDCSQYQLNTDPPQLNDHLVITLASDEPWEAQQRWWQLAAGNFERLGYADATLADERVIRLFETLRDAGQVAVLLQFIAIATRHVFDELAAADGHSFICIQRRPYLDFDAALSSIARPAEVDLLDLNYNDMTAVPASLSRFGALEELRILDNPLPASERARLETLVPGGCKIS
jgi:hypothetical protein